MQLDAPQRRNQEAVVPLIWNDGQLAEPDRHYVQHVDDLVALGRDKEHSWTNSLIEELCTKASRRWSKTLFQDRIQTAKTACPDLGIHLHSKSRLDKVGAFVFTLIIIWLIMDPMFVLYKLRKESGYVQNAVTLGSTTFFVLLCSTCTTAKRHEIFAATAAYCPVLVVFTSPK